MVFLFEHARVNDYDTWHRIFVGFGATLKAKGIVASSVYRGVDDSNDVTVIHEFATRDEAQAFLDSTKLHAARKRADVSTRPTVWFTEKVSGS